MYTLDEYLQPSFFLKDVLRRSGHCLGCDDFLRDQKYAIRKREARAYVRTKLANAHSIFTPEAVIQYCTRASGRRQKTA